MRYQKINPNINLKAYPSYPLSHKINPDTTDTAHPPKRIKDLLWAKSLGRSVICTSRLEIVPAEFFQKNQWWQGHLFLCRFTGTIEHTPFTFRKCYANSQVNNRCRQEMNVVMAANRYLQKDYKRFTQAGIRIPKNFFSLQDLPIKQNTDDNSDCLPMTIYDFINIANEGNHVVVEVSLDTMAAVEHYAKTDRKRTYMMADFSVIALGNISHCQRCLASYPTNIEKAGEKAMARVANKRLQAIYHSFTRGGIYYNERFFT